MKKKLVNQEFFRRLEMVVIMMIENFWFEELVNETCGDSNDGSEEEEEEDWLVLATSLSRN